MATTMAQSHLEEVETMTTTIAQSHLEEVETMTTTMAKGHLKGKKPMNPMLPPEEKSLLQFEVNLYKLND